MNTVFTIISQSGIVFEMLALLFAIIHYKKYAYTQMFIILPYLSYLVATEFFCKFIYHQQNQVFYNPVFIIEILFYLYGFYVHFMNPTYKKVTIFLALTFIVLVVVNIIQLSSFFDELISYAYSIGCVFIIILYLLYIYELLSTEKPIVIQQSLFFWIVQGIFLFLILRSIPEFILYNHTNPLSFDENAILKIISYLGSDILYLFFIIGFIKCKSVSSSN